MSPADRAERKRRIYFEELREADRKCNLALAKLKRERKKMGKTYIWQSRDVLMSAFDMAPAIQRERDLYYIKLTGEPSAETREENPNWRETLLGEDS